jgi:amino acid transporter
MGDDTSADPATLEPPMSEPPDPAPGAPAGETPEAVKAPLTVRGATLLGIGSIIGAGTFALLGEAGAVAGTAVWVSFLVGGCMAFLLGYVSA